MCIRLPNLVILQKLRQQHFHLQFNNFIGQVYFNKYNFIYKLLIFNNNFTILMDILIIQSIHLLPIVLKLNL
jgi:hypothetical protein